MVETEVSGFYLRLSAQLCSQIQGRSHCAVEKRNKRSYKVIYRRLINKLLSRHRRDLHIIKQLLLSNVIPIAHVFLSGVATLPNS